MASVSSAAGESLRSLRAGVARDQRSCLRRGDELDLVACRDQPETALAQRDLKVAQQRVDSVRLTPASAAISRRVSGRSATKSSASS